MPDVPDLARWVESGPVVNSIACKERHRASWTTVGNKATVTVVCGTSALASAEYLLADDVDLEIAMFVPAVMHVHEVGLVRALLRQMTELVREPGSHDATELLGRVDAALRD